MIKYYNYMVKNASGLFDGLMFALIIIFCISSNQPETIKKVESTTPAKTETGYYFKLYLKEKEASRQNRIKSEKLLENAKELADQPK